MYPIYIFKHIFIHAPKHVHIDYAVQVPYMHTIQAIHMLLFFKVTVSTSIIFNYSDNNSHKHKHQHTAFFDVVVNSTRSFLQNFHMNIPCDMEFIR